MDPFDRKVLRVTGADRVEFLQNLVTNDVNGLKDGLVWTALLNPQGKYLADFFLVPAEDAILIDVAEPLAAGLLQRLSMYKLRANVALEATDIAPTRGTGETPEGAYADPRHPSLGWRGYAGQPGNDADWTALRVAACVPETGIELLPNDTYVLEARFIELNGVDFKKGCYVGQEVTARMHHKTTLRKGLRVVNVTGAAAIGTEILSDAGKPVGTLYSQANGKAIAYLRFDRVTPVMSAGDAVVTLVGEDEAA